jgi:DNA-binding transcriptional MerR regulator
VANSFTLLEVAQHLQVSPETLRALSRRYERFLSGDAASFAGDWPTFSQADVAVLLTIHSLLDQGYTEQQVTESLQPKRIEPPRLAPDVATHELAAAPRAAGTGIELAEVGGAAGGGQAGQVLGEVLGAIAGSQQAVLNSQASMREMVSVVVQDNFNLKDENRKLRERMLELERALAEYQRREETRKERMEARMRAMEGTMAALQQQMAQFVQIQRAQQKKRGLW